MKRNKKGMYRNDIYNTFDKLVTNNLQCFCETAGSRNSGWTLSWLPWAIRQEVKYKGPFFSATTFSMTALSITTLSITTLSGMTCNVMTCGVMTCSITLRKCNTQHNDIQPLWRFTLCWVSYMLSVEINSFLLSVILMSLCWWSWQRFFSLKSCSIYNEYSNDNLIINKWKYEGSLSKALTGFLSSLLRYLS